MLVLNLHTDKRVTLTLTEALPAGTELEIFGASKTAAGMRIGFTAPRSVSIEREDACVKTPKSRPGTNRGRQT